MNNTSGFQTHLRSFFSATLLACLFFSLPEVDIIDFIFASSVKKVFLLISMFCLGCLIVLQLLNANYKISKVNIVVWLFYSILLFISFIFNDEIVLVLFLQPAMIFCLSIFLSSSDIVKHRKIFYYIALFICFSSAVSLLTHLLLPIDIVHRNAFQDSTNTSQNIVLISFSPSFYQFGGLLIPRMSAVFDEPGTFGFFVSIFGSLLYCNGKYKIARIVFFSGLASFSTAYLLFFALTMPVWLFDNTKKSIRNVFILIVATILFQLFIPEISAFIQKRFVYAFSPTHNRADGWSVALNSISYNPLWGGLLSGYKAHSIHASGIIVVMAYIGVPAAIFLLGLSLVPIMQQVKIIQSHKMTSKALWVLMIAVGTTVANRNNFFNYSGYTLVLFCIAAASTNLSVTSTSHDRKVLTRLS